MWLAIHNNLNIEESLEKFEGIYDRYRGLIDRTHKRLVEKK